MGANTNIAWCDHTFNPWIGCSKVHTGCEHCYAEADMDKRRRRVQWGPQGTRSKTSQQYWEEPRKWNERADSHRSRPRVFCASLCDIFEDWDGPIVDHLGRQLFTFQSGSGSFTESNYPDCRPLTMGDLRYNLFRLIDSTPNLDWLLLTKRPENIIKFWQSKAGPTGYIDFPYRENVWLGTSVSDQKTAAMALELIDCRYLTPVLFLSAEPLVAPISLECCWEKDKGSWSKEWDVLEGVIWNHSYDGHTPLAKIPSLDFVIVGGESGPKARPCHVEWILDIIKQCHHAGVPCFVKQLGSNAQITVNGLNCDMNLKDPKGGNPDEWPENLRIREFPKP